MKSISRPILPSHTFRLWEPVAQIFSVVWKYSAALFSPNSLIVLACDPWLGRHCRPSVGDYTPVEERVARTVAFTVRVFSVSQKADCSRALGSTVMGGKDADRKTGGPRYQLPTLFLVVAATSIHRTNHPSRAIPPTWYLSRAMKPACSK